MAKRVRNNSEGLRAPLALPLLAAMADAPDVLEYHTRVLGGAFTDESVHHLNAAYAELERFGFIKRSGTVIMFFGVPKVLYQITGKGLKRLKRGAA